VVAMRIGVRGVAPQVTEQESTGQGGHAGDLRLLADVRMRILSDPKTAASMKAGYRLFARYLFSPCIGRAGLGPGHARSSCGDDPIHSLLEPRPATPG